MLGRGFARAGPGPATRAALLLATGLLSLVLAGCGDAAVEADPQDKNPTRAVGEFPGSTGSDLRAEVTSCADIPDAQLPSDRSMDTVLDAEHGLLSITYNSGDDPNKTVVVAFLTDPTCAPGTRVWAVIDQAVSGAIDSGNSPWKESVDYPHALYTHCGVFETRFAGSWWAAETPLDEQSLPEGWGNPYQTGTMRLVDADRAVFRATTGQRVSFTREPAPQRPPCR